MATDLSHSIRFLCQHGRLPLRERYWKRGDGRWRLRYALCGYATVSALMSFSALSFSPALSTALERTTLHVAGLFSFPPPAPDMPVIPVLATAAPATTVAAVEPQAGEPLAPLDEEVMDSWRGPDGQIRRSAEVRNVAAMVQQSERDQGPRTQRLTIAAGDTLSGLLVQAGLDVDEAASAIGALRKHVKPSDLRPGQTLDLELAADDGGARFSKLSLAVDPVRTVQVERSWGGFYNAQIQEKPLKRDVTAQVAVVKASLYGAASAAGIPNAVTADAIRAFSHLIDFQRDIHPGDRLEIMYDRFVTDDGYVAKTGGIVFARLIADNRELSIYAYDSPDGRRDFYDRSGNSIRKALLRTPMDGARITSGFGMRRHPILGYSKMHKGLDYGAPTGTPIFAAGDGVVEKAGRYGSYGNYVRIKHNNSLRTAYAHMSRFASDMRPGSHVRQGQVIGYVGTTGRSTGPHLHYEVVVNNVQVNPQSVNLPTAVALSGADLRKFKDRVARLDREFKDRVQGLRFASATEQDPSELLVQ